MQTKLNPAKNFIPKSGFFKEFHERGYFHQATHLSELDELMASTKITAYIGFDCTAKSLHVGSLIQIMILRLLQKHGHTPIVLLGGGTTKIGDPSGKDEARQFLSEEQIEENLVGIAQTLRKFDLSLNDKSLPPFQFVDNDSWLKNLNYVELLRDVGPHFTINRMMTFDSVKLRLEREQPLTFIEFNYMILQAYDFYHLNIEYKKEELERPVILQIGGSDQWGNIINGVELIRKEKIKEDSKQEVQKTFNTFDDVNKAKAWLEGTGLSFQDRAAIVARHLEKDNPDYFTNTSSAFGLTTPLLTTSDGKKMGKTADGAVWLSANMLDPFEYFQYFRNVTDADVSRFLKLFTELSLDEIKEIESQNINEQKKRLAFEATKICHGEKAAQEARDKAQSIFEKKSEEDLPIINFSEEKSLFALLVEAKISASNGEAKRLIKGGAVKINDEKITDEFYRVEPTQSYKLSAGKKHFFKLIPTSKTN